MNVIIYLSPTCPYCIELKKFLDEKKISHVDKDITQSKEIAEEAMKKSGQSSVPIIDIDGKIVVGFDKERISTLLKI